MSSWTEKIQDASDFYAQNYVAASPDVELPPTGPEEVDTMAELIEKLAEAYVMAMCQKNRVPLMELPEQHRYQAQYQLGIMLELLPQLGTMAVTLQQKLEAAGY